MSRSFDSTSAGAILVDCSYDEYRKQLQVVSLVGLPLFSPLTGFASEAISLGEDPGSVCLRGRWQSETCFRICVDVISAAMVDDLDSLCTFRPMLAVSEAVLLDVFVPEVFLMAARPRRSQGPEPSPRPSNVLSPRCENQGKKAGKVGCGALCGRVSKAKSLPSWVFS